MGNSLTKKILVLLGLVIFIYYTFEFMNDTERQYAVIEKEYQEKQNTVDKVQKSILYIGNSHTFTHNVPRIVNIILLSMNLDTQYSYKSITEGGVDLKYHWNNEEVKKALKKKNDFVIIQPHSADILKDIVNNPNAHPTDFYQFGVALLGEAKKQSPKVGLYQTWIPHLQKPLALQEQYISAFQTYNQTMNKDYDNRKFEQAERDYLNYTQSNHYAKLANQTFTNLIPVAKSWHKAEKECSSINLFSSDQYHASIHGAYLIALTIVRFINDNKIIPDTLFVPNTISSEDARCLVKTVNSNV